MTTKITLCKASSLTTARMEVDCINLQAKMENRAIISKQLLIINIKGIDRLKGPIKMYLYLKVQLMAQKLLQH